MIDLETMGLDGDAAVTAVGAVAFDPDTGEIVGEFYRTISLESAMRSGGSVTPGTIIWWMQQSEEAKREIINATCTLEKALIEFQKWLGSYTYARVWGNGANFDNTIIRSAFKSVKMSCPWPFWGDSCYRTLKGLRPDIPFIREGVHHNALDDARSQAKHLVQIMKVL